MPDDLVSDTKKEVGIKQWVADINSNASKKQKRKRKQT